MSVDESRKELIDSLSDNQKDMYLIGMCYHSAYMSYAELKEGKSLNLVDEFELKAVKDAMRRQGLETEINT